MTVRYEFGPLERRGVFLGARPGQVVVALSTTTVVVATFSAWPTPPGALAALAALAIGGAAALLPFAGRTAEQWLPVATRFLFGCVTGDRCWLGSSQLRGHELLQVAAGTHKAADPVAPSGDQISVGSPGPPEDDDGDDNSAGPRWVATVRRLDGGDPQPPWLRGVQILGARWRQGEIGVVKDARRRTYVGVIAARGRSFALLEQDARERLLTHWGTVLASLARDAGVVTRVQWLERTVPDDSAGVVGYLQERCALPITSPFVTSYLSLLDEAGPQTQEHEVLIALQVSAWRASPVIRRLRRGVDIGACEILSRELDLFAAALRRAEVDVRGVLSPRMLAAALRHAVDPPSREQLAHRSAANPELAGASPRGAFPRSCETTWSTLRTEGAHHATYWVSEWPRVGVGADWMAPLLLGTRCRRTVSVVIEPCAPTAALRHVESSRIDDATTQSFRERLGFRTSERRRREEDNVARAEAELNEGYPYLRFSAYITVTACTARELDAACADVEQQARQARLDVRREYGAQDIAFAYTLPLCRGLR